MFYAISRPNGMNTDYDARIHRFDDPDDRDAWVALDDEHREMVLARHELARMAIRHDLWIDDEFGDLDHDVTACAVA